MIYNSGTLTNHFNLSAESDNLFQAIIKLRLCLKGVVLMPRTAREKTSDSVFHIMCRSLDEVDLFKEDADKVIYLKYVKHYMGIFKFKLYSYCLMDNHVHMMIDANGADISMIMHGINYSYVMYFNRKHGRRGHLLEDRFRSKIVNSDGYLIGLSAYIHYNPIKKKDMRRTRKSIHFQAFLYILD
jgi:REP element-mobilizing transposase RayT